MNQTSERPAVSDRHGRLGPCPCGHPVHRIDPGDLAALRSYAAGDPALSRATAGHAADLIDELADRLCDAELDLEGWRRTAGAQP